MMINCITPKRRERSLVIYIIVPQRLKSYNSMTLMKIITTLKCHNCTQETIITLSFIYSSEYLQFRKYLGLTLLNNLIPNTTVSRCIVHSATSCQIKRCRLKSNPFDLYYFGLLVILIIIYAYNIVLHRGSNIKRINVF